jgi:hypothetical protein
LDWGLTILVLGCLRAFMRLVREELRPRLFGGEYHKALIVGANQSGETLSDDQPIEDDQQAQNHPHDD